MKKLLAVAALVTMTSAGCHHCGWTRGAACRPVYAPAPIATAAPAVCDPCAGAPVISSGTPMISGAPVYGGDTYVTPGQVIPGPIN